MDYPPTERTDRRFVWITLGIAAAMLVVAIAVTLDLGPSDDELPEGEFLTQADSICADARREFTQAQRIRPTTPGEAGELARNLVEIASEEQDRIAELDPPAEMDAALERYLQAREEGIDQMRAGVDAAADRDAFAYEQAQADVAAGQLRRLQLARRVGFTECSRILGERAELADDAKAPSEATPQGAPPTIENPPTGSP